MRTSNNKDITNNWYCATGRRKTSTARIFIRPGQRNVIMINGQSLEHYFSRETHRAVVKQPILEVCQLPLIIKVNVMGGGKTGQAEAISLGVSRVLANLSNTFKKQLTKLGLLTRDPRKVERKKVGLSKARKGKQFSKR